MEMTILEAGRMKRVVLVHSLDGVEIINGVEKGLKATGSGLHDIGEVHVMDVRTVVPLIFQQTESQTEDLKERLVHCCHLELLVLFNLVLLWLIKQGLVLGLLEEGGGCRGNRRWRGEIQGLEEVFVRDRTG